ncbi:hypothetical protein M9Y10_009444 [Tritrichomonas musculus]|uniref:Initiator binding domain-containing protein n=1 Tax=Tritrichomonas musculus TaxID=1915356 RepID=A0ABR2INC9_9EUKA
MVRVANSTEKKFSDPQYFDLLPESDKKEYIELRNQLFDPKYKNRRNKSHEAFREVVQSIEKFVVKHDGNDWKRSLVCGIIWLDQSIAINTHQLRLLVDKCKSSINGSFQDLGYKTVPTGADSAKELITKFPFMRNNFSELRQWTIRQKSPSTTLLTDEIIEEIKKSEKEISKNTTSIENNTFSNQNKTGSYTLFYDNQDEITPPPDLIGHDFDDAFSFNFPSIIDESSSKLSNEIDNFPSTVFLDDTLSFLPNFNSNQNDIFSSVDQEPSI